MSNEFLTREEIDALLNGQSSELNQQETDEDLSAEISPVQEFSGSPINEEQKMDEVRDTAAAAEQSVTEPAILTDEEKDALGEIGNICMGSSSTTLSMLLNQPVSITSPKVSITGMEELFRSFEIPHISIYVKYTQGFSGFNLLIMRLPDAAVMADLMMGGNGKDISGELTEIGISAASEAMNQMIGAASTALSTMFDCTVNISPPITKIYHNQDEVELPEHGQVVVVWFKMTIGKILDTQIMQVMDIATAREEAGLILGKLTEKNGEEGLLTLEKSAPHELPDNQILKYKEEDTGIPVAKSTAAIQPESGNPAVTSSGIDQRRLELILDIPLKVTVLLGRTRWPIKDILSLKPGSVVELQNLVDEPVEVLVNGTLVAMGEVVVVNENFGVRLTSIIDPEQRLRYLRK